ncbi:DUF1800 domain-containing protein [Salipiger mucosus]|uniref:DUF1800 domain-containing protein n=1 Tax=Salipiger mucosus DSM 16094 TaxID=1123237 RepID=S9RP01_9RHOB|nr:DUF1800 domain-containing protein [Salipiger mucosus]EPX79820.1 hypothetical protein Salmuc_02582 [Salipiger mucosus DSM 16094]
MADFDPILAEIRFGCGLSPTVPPAQSAEAMLATLDSPDTVAKTHPIEPFPDFLSRITARREQQKIRSANRGTAKGEAARERSREINIAARKASAVWMARHIARRIETEAPFRERLSFFWADHFTAIGKAGVIRRGTSPYMQSAIRPHVAGRFEDLLISAVTHPLMLHYLDQNTSVGPNSRLGRRRPDRGVNENLAREILELHTLGVDGPYTQADVRELAELLTGLTFHHTVGRSFRKDIAEPGVQTVLRRGYGGDEPRLGDVKDALRDLARHPATARHLAHKLAVHFVSDRPDPDLVKAIETALLDSGCELRRGYAAMLAHPAAWDDRRPNVKQPFDFVSSALRALAVAPEALTDLREGVFRLRIQQPIQTMGHAWQQPDGPDGLDEADSAWITPQGIATRLRWAVTVPQFLRRDLPDPRDFVTQALGPRATPAVRFAAESAESRADGVGLVLASPAFQRM